MIVGRADSVLNEYLRLPVCLKKQLWVICEVLIRDNNIILVQHDCCFQHLKWKKKLKQIKPRNRALNNIPSSIYMLVIKIWIIACYTKQVFNNM